MNKIIRFTENAQTALEGTIGECLQCTFRGDCKQVGELSVCGSAFKVKQVEMAFDVSLVTVEGAFTRHK